MCKLYDVIKKQASRTELDGVDLDYRLLPHGVRIIASHTVDGEVLDRGRDVVWTEIEVAQEDNVLGRLTAGLVQGLKAEAAAQ